MRFLFDSKVYINDQKFFFNATGRVIGYQIGLDEVNIAYWLIRFDNGHEEMVKDAFVFEGKQ